MREHKSLCRADKNDGSVFIRALRASSVVKISLVRSRPAKLVRVKQNSMTAAHLFERAACRVRCEADKLS